jgi:hypothetical protein
MKTPRRVAVSGGFVQQHEIPDFSFCSYSIPHSKNCFKCSGRKKLRSEIAISTEYAKIILLSNPFWQQKGGCKMENMFLTFLLSIVASIIAYYICKRLDGK